MTVRAVQYTRPTHEYNKQFTSENQVTLTNWNLLDKMLELDADEETTKETIEWEQVRPFIYYSRVGGLSWNKHCNICPWN